MYDNYPPGAANDPNAPYNQCDLPEIDVDVTVSTSLSKSTVITTNDYEADSWEDWDTGDEGETIHTGGTDYDFSNTDFEELYRKSEYTPLELIEVLKDKCQKELEELMKEINPLRDKWGNYVYPPDKRHLANKRAELQGLIQACEGWTEDELEVVQD